MTERTLPTIGVGIRPRPAVDAEPRPAHLPATSAARAADRTDTILFTPARAGMLLGASAALYAVTLAGISTLQAQDDAALAASRAPYLDVVAEARAANDALEARVQAADQQITALVATYGTMESDVEAFRVRLDTLAAMVADVQGSAASLPARIKLPTVSIRGPVASSSSGASRVSAPKTSAKSGASGR